MDKLEILEDLYERYNRREYVSPDPLEFLYNYDSDADREAAGLIASSLAYGRVASILSSAGRALGVLGANPASALASMDEAELRTRLGDFKHRFNDAEETAKFMAGIGSAIRKYGRLENLFLSRTPPGGGCSATLAAMDGFAAEILALGGMERSHLLPRASKGSACKRLALFIRWMSRLDDVDPGGWDGVSPRDIMVPLDTHMFRIASGLGFVTRVSAGGAAAAEATEGFRALCPDDPAKYDFALTRFGIRTGMSVEELLAKFS
jgi:uncharacterized protein (TIGR02757 family)